jgi:transposase
MDNASPHGAEGMKEFLNITGLIRIIWPPNSPDINPIEQIWVYIRKQIRIRRKTGTYPTTDKEMFEAWKEE